MEFLWISNKSLKEIATIFDDDKLKASTGHKRSVKLVVVFNVL